MNARWIGRHDMALMLYNMLVIDIKLEMMGVEHEPITVERLDEVSNALRQDLEQCGLVQHS